MSIRSRMSRFCSSASRSFSRFLIYKFKATAKLGSLVFRGGSIFRRLLQEGHLAFGGTQGEFRRGTRLLSIQSRHGKIHFPNIGTGSNSGSSHHILVFVLPELVQGVHIMDLTVTLVALVYLF